MCKSVQDYADRAAAKATAKAAAKATAEAAAEGRAEAIERLLKKNKTPEEIYDLLGYPMEEIKKVEESL